jgi:tRNA A-37 threonylcarbamoyl transferase component Bud32
VVALVALAQLYLGVAALADLLVGVAIGVAVPLLGFRWFAPSQVFPIGYRRGRSAHLDVGGARGQAIRRALHDQLGLVVTEVKPFGLAGSAGSTPLRLEVKGDPPQQLFGKLYARSHLRADRWYKLGRELLYGRLEDEKPFNTVRRLVQQEDYALQKLYLAGLPTPRPYGIVELTPEREYLLVTEFFDGAVELGEATVDDQVIDDGLGIIRRLWAAGLAHRDIKPANLLVRDGRMLLIDVFFTEVRPTPWREAVDLANMMLCLALRSSPELVYQRARRQFSVEEIGEGFAAARGLALPSQLRRMLRDQGRDLHAEFLRLLPARPRPFRIQRWSGRRVGLLLLVVPVVALLLPALPVVLGNHDVNITRLQVVRLDCDRPEPLWLEAQSVPSASLVPCARAARLAAGRRQRPQRVVPDHPQPRPGRRARHGGSAQRHLRPGRGGRAALAVPGRPPLPADRAPGRRLQRHLARPVPGRLRDLPAAVDGRPRRPVRHRGPGRARVRPPTGPRAAAGRTLRRAAPPGPLQHRFQLAGMRAADPPAILAP